MADTSKTDKGLVGFAVGLGLLALTVYVAGLAWKKSQEK